MAFLSVMSSVVQGTHTQKFFSWLALDFFLVSHPTVILPFFFKVLKCIFSMKIIVWHLKYCVGFHLFSSSWQLSQQFLNHGFVGFRQIFLATLCLLFSSWVIRRLVKVKYSIFQKNASASLHSQPRNLIVCNSCAFE